MINSINQWGFKLIYGFAGHHQALDVLGIFFADYLQYVLALVFLVILFYPKHRIVAHREMVLLSVFSAGVARIVLKSLILFLYQEPRPYVHSETVKALIRISASEDLQSFPSGHALFFFAIAMMVYLFDKRMGWYFFGAAFLIGLGRVYVGVHYPLDILVGAVLGIATSWAVYKFFYKYFRQRVKI